MSAKGGKQTLGVKCEVHASENSIRDISRLIRAELRLAPQQEKREGPTQSERAFPSFGTLHVKGRNASRHCQSETSGGKRLHRASPFAQSSAAIFSSAVKQLSDAVVTSRRI